MQCLAAKHVPEGDAWEYELKLDGYRTLAMKHGCRLTLFSRNKKTFNARFPGVVAALQNLPDESIIDGEIVAMDEFGRPSFNRLQNFSKSAEDITFYAFDVLVWKGENLQAQALDRRRDLLRTKVMPKLPAVRSTLKATPVTAQVVVNVTRTSCGGDVISVTGNSVINNTSGISGNLVFNYAGTGTMKIAGGTTAYYVVNAPNSAVTIHDGSDLYGAVIANSIDDSSGVNGAVKPTTRLAGEQVIGTIGWPFAQPTPDSRRFSDPFKRRMEMEAAFWSTSANFRRLTRA
jgi:hypothetical protein